MTPSKKWTSPPIIRVTEVRKRAFLFIGVTPAFSARSISKRSFDIFALKSFPSPAYLAVWTPGAPPRMSTSSPVSSAKQSIPVFSYMYEAFCRELSLSVFPVSGMSSVTPASAALRISKPSPRISDASLILPGFALAKTIFLFSI